MKITGSGSSQSPYLVGLETPLNEAITVIDSPTLNLNTVPSDDGTVQIYGDTLTKMTDLKDVADTEGPQVGDSPVWMGNHWEFRPPTTVAPGVIHAANGISGDGTLATPLVAMTSGVFGTAPITTARYAGVQDFGDEVYLDTAGKLRSKPKMLWTNLTGTAPPSAYPNGWSILTVNSANVGGGTGWPGNFYGAVETIKRMETSSAQDNGQVQQRFYKNNSGDVFYRWAANDAGGWSAWVQTAGVVVEDTGWVNLTPASGTGPCQYRCVAGVINFQCSLASVTSIGVGASYAFVPAGSIPVAYRPRTMMSTMAWTGGGTGMLVVAGTSGDVTAWNTWSAAVTNIRTGMTWLKE